MVSEVPDSGTPRTDPVVDAPAVRVRPLHQWWVLTARGVKKIVTNGEIFLAFLSPALLALCFYLPLRKLVDTSGFDYAQFLMPIIMLQSVAFVASSAAMRSANERDNIHNRFRVLPMYAAIPMLARTSINSVLLGIALVCGLIACLLMGWRPDTEYGGGYTGTLIAVAVAGVFGFLLAMTADGIGLVAASPTATSQLIAFPTLILGMLSTGFVPLSAFPTWIQGFVEHQPISQITTVMRYAEAGDLTWEVCVPTFWWCIGLLVISAGLLAVAEWRTRR